ncbi:MAG: sigma-70 family RNA polymerase sigma factor [Bacteroidales bacterium]|nr:sigma-70 family RNA polymerase sigma factor [Bacteroidales bacterium]MDD2425220.1 sigma-70 family RNA polymerase sigma factor [Bacteroidales bacterium]MDD3989929.1 sigma-70 family RNA polymerase sigma factor [Bacteroidales bacterium]
MNTTSREIFNEAELLESCVKQDRRAQKTLYEFYAPRMLTLCIRYIGDRERARDILHDGFITVFEKIGSYNGSGSFEGWMRRIFVNTALMALRKGDILKYSEELVTAEREITGEQSVLENINSRELLRLISSMPAGFRAVFNMYAIEGYSHQEIAKQMKISEGSSRSQLSRARAWLQERLTGK